MKYLALIYIEPGAGPQPGAPDFASTMEEYFTIGERTKDHATRLAGEGLKPVATATTVRSRGGKLETMDGPFAETREHLAGFYMIEAADLDGALKFAAAIPAVRFGSIELRPVMDY